MGTDCAYVAGSSPPVSSKACFATYALADYLINVSPSVDTSLAFNVMSLSNDCSGASYDPALIASTSLPVASDSALVQRIGEALDYGRVNVTLTEGTSVTTIPQAANEAACPTDQPAWYYDSPNAPTKIFLCEDACATVSAAGDGAELNVVAGCTNTIVVQ